jgi:hypothetical protein
VLIDEYMPVHDHAAVHSVVVRAPVSSVDAAVLNLDLRGSWLIRSLYTLRGLPAAGLTLAGLEQIGFQRLGHRPGEELLLGLIGRFWTVRGGLLPFEPAGFAAFDRPGFARAVWNFSMTAGAGGTTRLATETRIICTDAASRRRFARYWAVIRPFSGVIRRETLRVVRERAEAES